MPFISHHSKPPLDIIKIVGSSNSPMFNKIGANTQPNPHLIILDFHKRNRTNVVNKVIIYYSSIAFLYLISKSSNSDRINQ